jgi:hypothetical protein
MGKLSEIFDLAYGHSLELNRLQELSHGVNFVSRTAKNNGVACRVTRIQTLEPERAGRITVALSGSVLETFLQPEDFYTAFHVMVLTPKTQMTIQQKLYYCSCIRANKYRYNYGRQANRTLRDILLPAVEEIPEWVGEMDAESYRDIEKPASSEPASLPPIENWKEFAFTDLFEVKKGRRIVKAKLQHGTTPFVTAIDNNNGLREFFSGQAIFKANTLTVPYNGNGVAEAFYQPNPYWACDDVNVLYPKFRLSPAIGMFLATLIRKEKYRFSYGRKWHKERMESSVLKLPTDKSGRPDWGLIEKFINSLPFTSQLAD